DPATLRSSIAERNPVAVRRARSGARDCTAKAVEVASLPPPLSVRHDEGEASGHCCPQGVLLVGASIYGFCDRQADCLSHGVVKRVQPGRGGRNDPAVSAFTRAGQECECWRTSD